MGSEGVRYCSAAQMCFQHKTLKNSRWSAVISKLCTSKLILNLSIFIHLISDLWHFVPKRLSFDWNCGLRREHTYSCSACLLIYSWPIDHSWHVQVSSVLLWFSRAAWIVTWVRLSSPLSVCPGAGLHWPSKSVKYSLTLLCLALW